MDARRAYEDGFRAAVLMAEEHLGGVARESPTVRRALRVLRARAEGLADDRVRGDAS